ncbi:MAG TPA: heme-binding domain-containing protein [Candidatus Tectomicrobia bacterium]
MRAGRRELNFSTWNRYDTRQQAQKLQKSWRKIAADKMPPWLYTVPHLQARLSAKDRWLLHTSTASRALTLQTTRENVSAR